MNDTPVLQLQVLGSFEDHGNFVLAEIVPPGLSGRAITFRGYALGCRDHQVVSNDVTVSFQ